MFMYFVGVMGGFLLGSSYRRIKYQIHRNEINRLNSEYDRIKNKVK